MKHIGKCWGIFIGTVVVAALFVAVPPTAVQASTSIINFDSLPPFSDYDHIPNGYGSTADVTVSYQTLNADFTTNLNYVEIWNSGYANLNTAAFAAFNGGILDMTLQATNPSDSVVLNSFVVAAYPGPRDFTQGASVLEVRDGNGNVLVNYAPVVPFQVSGSVAQTLSPGVAAHSISILLGTNWNNGINDINFSSGSSNSVPEPATMLLLGLGLAGLAGVRRKVQK